MPAKGAGPGKAVSEESRASDAWKGSRAREATGEKPWKGSVPLGHAFRSQAYRAAAVRPPDAALSRIRRTAYPHPGVDMSFGASIGRGKTLPRAR